MTRWGSLMVKHLFCKQDIGGSSPFPSSFFPGSVTVAHDPLKVGDLVRIQAREVYL